MKILILIAVFIITQSYFAQCVSGDCENGFGKFVYKNGDWAEGYWKNKKLVPNMAGESKCVYTNLKQAKQKIESYYDKVKDLINSNIPFDSTEIISLKKEAEESYIVFKNELDDKLLKKYNYLLNLFPKHEFFEFNFTLFQSKNFSIYEKNTNEDGQKIIAILKTDLPFRSMEIRLPNSFFKIGFGPGFYTSGVYKQSDINPEFSIYHDYNTIYNQDIYYIVSRIDLNKTKLKIQAEWPQQFKDFEINFDKTATLVNLNVSFRETEENLKLNLSKCNSNSKLQIFLKKYGHYKFSEAVEEAKTTYESVIFSEIQTTRDIEQCKSFINLYPNSKYVNEVKSKIDFLENARKNYNDNSEKTIEFYLTTINKYPNTNESDLAIQSLVNYFEGSKKDNVEGYVDTVDLIHTSIKTILNEIQSKELKKKYTKGLQLVSLNGFGPKKTISTRLELISKNWNSYQQALNKDWIDRDELSLVSKVLNDTIIGSVLDNYLQRLTKCQSKEEQDRLLVECYTKFPNIVMEDLIDQFTHQNGDSKSEYFNYVLSRAQFVDDADVTVYDSSYFYNWVHSTGEFDELKNLCYWISLPGTAYCEDLSQVNKTKLHFKKGSFSGKQVLYKNNELFCEIFFLEGSMYNNISEINIYSDNQKISTRFFDWPEIGKNIFTSYVYEFENGVNITLKELDKKIQQGINLLNSKNYNAAIQHFELLRSNKFPNDLKQNLLLDDKIKTLTGLLGDSIKWIVNDFDFAYEKSFNEGKPLFIYFTSTEWASEELNGLIINTKQFKEWSESNFILLRLVYPLIPSKNPSEIDLKNKEIREDFATMGWPIYGFPKILLVQPSMPGSGEEIQVLLEFGLYSGLEDPKDWISNFEETWQNAIKKTELSMKNTTSSVNTTSNTQPINNSQKEDNKATTNQEIPVYDISNRKQNNGNAQRIYSKSEIDCKDDKSATTFGDEICKVKATGELLNGVIEEIDKNEFRTYRYRYEYKDGKKHGVDQSWRNNQKISEISFINGKMSGPYFEWHENGQKKVEGFRQRVLVTGGSSGEPYSAGIWSGDYNEWHSNGVKKKECHYVTRPNTMKREDWSSLNGFAVGTLYGPYREWHSDGKKAVEGQYDDSDTGLQVGKWIYWHSNGRMAKIIEYQDGVNWKERRFKEDGGEIFPPFKD
jgi:antitoxin component YwqK of YwqJK toxin-antitoxin module